MVKFNHVKKTKINVTFFHYFTLAPLITIAFDPQLYQVGLWPLHCMKMNECGLSLCVCVRVLKWLSAWGLNYIQIPPLFRVFSAQRQFSGPWVIAFHTCLLWTYANLSRTISQIHRRRRGRGALLRGKVSRAFPVWGLDCRSLAPLPTHSLRIKSQKSLLPLQSFPHFPYFAAKRKSKFIFRLLGAAKRFSRCVECVGEDVWMYVCACVCVCLYTCTRELISGCRDQLDFLLLS